MLDRVPAYLDCPACGTSVSADHLPAHTCDARHRRDQATRILAAAAGELEADIRAYLESPRGRFELFYAQRTRNNLLP
jgi:hypothetical protein